MTVEILYGEIADLYGDRANAAYLQKCLPDAKFIHTPLSKKPAFARMHPDLIYMGSMSEHGQALAAAALAPYAARLKKLINAGTVFLFTGNAGEILGNSISRDNGETVDGLGVIDMTTSQKMFGRYNGLVLGEFEGMQIVGFRSQFSQSFPADAAPFVTVSRGRGINEGAQYEGLRINNLFFTNLLGPFLICNPLFTEYLITLAGAQDFRVPFREQAMAAYERRLAEFNDKKTKFDIH